MNKLLITAALAGIMAAGAAYADEPAMAAKEKCYGIAKAGKNDCKSADGKHSCSGQAATDNEPNEWKFVDAGACEKEGGKLKPEAKM